MLARKKTTYDYLAELPEGVTGEILQGQLYAHPRPGGQHVLATTGITGTFYGPYHKGRGGPGGWWRLTEPEVHFERDREVAVPDVAGWRREGLPTIPESHKFDVVPDWICEVLSPSTESFDRELKMAMYARHGVQYLWLVHPVKITLEAYSRSTMGTWLPVATLSANDTVQLPPFEATPVSLRELLGLD